MDYKNDLKDQQDAISKLQKRIDVANKDDSLTGQKKLQELLNQMEEEQKKLQDMVANTLGNNTFTDVDGNVTSLKETMMNFLDESGESFRVLGDIIKNDLNSNLQQSIDAFKNLDSIYGKLNIPNVDYSSQMYTPSALRSTTNNNTNKTVEVNFNQPLCVIQGSVTEDVMPQVEKMIKKSQDEVVKNIVKSIR